MKSLMDRMPLPEYVIFLDVPVDVCHSRILARGRPNETVTKEYLQRLRRGHRHLLAWYQSRQVPIVTLNPKEINDDILETLKRKSSQALTSLAATLPWKNQTYDRLDEIILLNSTYSTTTTIVKFSLPTLPRRIDSGYYSPRKQYKNPFFSQAWKYFPSELFYESTKWNYSKNSGVYGYKFSTEFILNGTTYPSNASCKSYYSMYYCMIRFI